MTVKDETTPKTLTEEELAALSAAAGEDEDDEDDGDGEDAEDEDVDPTPAKPPPKPDARFAALAKAREVKAAKRAADAEVAKQVKEAAEKMTPAELEAEKLKNFDPEVGPPDPVYIVQRAITVAWQGQMIKLRPGTRVSRGSYGDDCIAKFRAAGVDLKVEET